MADDEKAQTPKKTLVRPTKAQLEERKRYYDNYRKRLHALYCERKGIPAPPGLDASIFDSYGEEDED
jgi:hypothetical protein